ncbi:hypothetical protein [Pedobacter frigoris]|uniref:hypothetical protein n=1 Tax=Pedobacter frigoris TaxID=2571272 RepID=UPI00292CE1C5|nr:hypothetical protein [Pedobacter frigoris]
MAQHATVTLDYYLSIPVSRRDDLGGIRHWNHLKMAIKGDVIWLKGLNEAELDSMAIKVMQGKCIYYEKDALLYKLNSLLPSGQVPSLLWTAIDRALLVKLPIPKSQAPMLKESLYPKIVPSDNTHEASAMIIPLDKLGVFLGVAPVIRLQRMKWVIIQPNIALLMGYPILPIPGEVYWKRNNFLFPAGCDLELPLISDALESIIDPAGLSWILWNKDSSYVKINKRHLTDLSLSSFKRSLEQGAEDL